MNMSQPRHKYSKSKFGGEISLKTNLGPELVVCPGLFRLFSS
jgi:hypothetical protein